MDVNSTEVLRTTFSTVECVRDFHILRLGARIFDLRKDGYQIEERRVEGTAYSEYRLRPARKIELPPAFEAKASKRASLSGGLFNII